ncbi:BLUF domain-containing protein [Maribacter sp. 2307ULW6-5]|uniref:BLUF domain-containing protein n=1 Tax=Maribacter sp. 2307ULW6-5 TaxID=3386275 RepID=UPI0039BD8319
MRSLIYRSKAIETFTLPDIYAMLSNAKDYNAAHGITGCLLYHNGHFLQLLEGEEENLERLFDKIVRDRRHQDVETLKHVHLRQRLFNEWSMAFHDYGANGHAAHFKMNQIDTFLNKSNAFSHKSELLLPFFSGVKEILFQN